MQTELVKYVRGRGSRRNQRVGVLIGRKHDDGVVVITASKAKVTAGDKFDPKLGLEIARARQYKNTIPDVPRSFDAEAIEFADRCKRYFRVETICMGDREI